MYKVQNSIALLYINNKQLAKKIFKYDLEKLNTHQMQD